MTTKPQDRKQSTKKPVIKTVYICNDSEVSDAHEEVFKEFVLVQMQMQAAVAGGGATADTVAKFDQLKMKEAELRADVRKNSIRFRFRSIGRKRFEALQAEYPATEAVKAKVTEMGGDPNSLDYDPDTFFPALCTATIVEPDDFDMKAAWDGEDWNLAELASLSQAAMEANTQRRVVQLGND